MILRGHEAGAAPDVILEELSPVGRLDDNALRRLVRQTDAQAIATLLNAYEPVYGRALRNALGVLASQHDWMMFETALDRAFVMWRLGALQRGRESDDMLSSYLSREIDVSNLMSALRLRQEQTEHTLDPARSCSMAERYR